MPYSDNNLLINIEDVWNEIEKEKLLSNSHKEGE